MEEQELKNKVFREKVKNKLGDEYTVLGDYINSKTKIKMRHEKCGHEYETLAGQLTRAKPTRCPKCFGTPKKKQEDFEQEVEEKGNGEYEVLGKYKTNKEKILMKHKTCGYQYEVTPKDFLTGYRCPKCFGTPKKKQEDFEQEVEEKGNGEYEVLGKYEGTNKHILMKHKICGHTWLVTPNNFLNQETRCPICSRMGDSEGIRIIKNYLDKNNISYSVEKQFKSCKNINLLSFDFYLKDYNLLIEFDGDFHFKNPYDPNKLKNDRLRDSIKNKWVLHKKISILRIDESNKKNIETILDEILKENNSSTTIKTYNLYYINEDSKLINDNNKYEK